MLKFKYERKFFSTTSKNTLYGYALRDKFAAICHADLIGKVLSKTENDFMLLRSQKIQKDHVGNTYAVYNGFTKFSLEIKANMVGFRVGEFVPCRKIKNLNSKDLTLSVRKYQKPVKKSTVVLGKDRKNLQSTQFKILKTLYFFK